MILSSGILSSGSASVQLRTGISGALRRHAQTLAALRMVDAQRMLGTWSLQQELEEKEPKTFFLTLIDGGTSVEPQVLAARALSERADAIALSTYNGVALSYYNALRKHLDNQIPVLIGGRLNQVLDGSNTSLPVDVGDQLGAAGAYVCREIEDAVPALLAALKETE